MQNKKVIAYLLLITFVSLALRLYFSLQSPEFSSDEAYFTLRHVNYIMDNKIPMFYDDLSYSGRQVAYPPLFHYILAFFSLLFPLGLVAKIIPALFSATICIIVYMLSYELTKDKAAAIFSALFSAFVPAIISRTLNAASPYSLALPLFFLILYCLFKLREERTYLVYFVVLTIIFPLVHPSSFLLLLTLLMYSVIMISENLIIRRTIKEAVIFSVLVILFIQFLIFRGAFLTYGMSVIWQNTPEPVLSSYFNNLSLTSTLFTLGMLPVILGTIAVLLITFTSRKDSNLLMVSALIATLAAMFSRLISPSEAVLFLSLTLAVLSSIAISKISKYLDLTKISGRKTYLAYTLVFLTLILSVTPSLIAANSTMKRVPAGIDLEALDWIKHNLEEDTVIAALPEEGNLVAHYTGKKIVVDDYYLLAPSPEERLTDIERLYISESEFEALDISQKYDIGFIFVSEKAKEKYSIQDLGYARGLRTCFDRRKYEDFAKIYQVRKC